jgi:hypothetical protein
MLAGSRHPHGPSLRIIVLPDRSRGVGPGFIPRKLFSHGVSIHRKIISYLSYQIVLRKRERERGPRWIIPCGASCLHKVKGVVVWLGVSGCARLTCIFRPGLRAGSELSTGDFGPGFNPFNHAAFVVHVQISRALCRQAAASLAKTT